MGLDRAPIEFQTFYFFHVWLDPPNADLENTQRLENNLCPGLCRCGADENISIKPKINQTHVLHH